MNRRVAGWLVICTLLCGCQLVDRLMGTPADESGEPVLATSVRQLVGTWHTRHHTIQFNRDGSYSADELGPQPCGTCGVSGNVWFEDDLFMVKDRQAGQSCFWGEVGSYEVTVLARGYIVFEALEDECEGRRIILERSVWLWGPAET